MTTLETVAGGRWVVHDGQICCRVGKNTRIVQLGASGFLGVTSDDLSADFIEWLTEETEAKIVFRKGPKITAMFGPHHLATVARALGAERRKAA